MDPPLTDRPLSNFGSDPTPPPPLRSPPPLLAPTFLHPSPSLSPHNPPPPTEPTPPPPSARPPRESSSESPPPPMPLQNLPLLDPLQSNPLPPSLPPTLPPVCPANSVQVAVALPITHRKDRSPLRKPGPPAAPRRHPSPPPRSSHSCLPLVRLPPPLFRKKEKAPPPKVAPTGSRAFSGFPLSTLRRSTPIPRLLLLATFLAPTRGLLRRLLVTRAPIVGDVKSTSLKKKSRSRSHLLLDLAFPPRLFRALLLRTHLERRIFHGMENIQMRPTLLANIFVRRHRC